MFPSVAQKVNADQQLECVAHLLYLHKILTSNSHTYSRWIATDNWLFQYPVNHDDCFQGETDAKCQCCITHVLCLFFNLALFYRTCITLVKLFWVGLFPPMCFVFWWLGGASHFKTTPLSTRQRGLGWKVSVRWVFSPKLFIIIVHNEMTVALFCIHNEIKWMHTALSKVSMDCHIFPQDLS